MKATLIDLLRELMKQEALVRVVVDTQVDEFYVRMVDGKIEQVGKDVIVVERAAISDERFKHNVANVRVAIPLARVAEVIYYERVESTPS
ncbi:MAG: hypothetical protein ACFFEA_10285 [Candidatus Thorarchaeota archaeon]